ncbi:hypothetical protein [Streptomyces pseudovenezuelae]|uniref:hypothetical protein n=1 Tax=Streptomyces pseudovenezuelae TaxID=67350 RepID=UPI0036EEC05E
MTNSSPYNDQIPTDPRTLILLIFTCYALAITLPPEQVQSFTELINTATTLLTMGRR